MKSFNENATTMETMLGKINVDLGKNKAEFKTTGEKISILKNLSFFLAQELLNSTLDETMELLQKGELDEISI